MTAPSSYPDYATNTNYTIGPDVGTATKIEPSAGELAEGNIRGPSFAPAAQKFNWWQNLVGLWIRHIGEEKIPEYDDAIEDHEERIEDAEALLDRVSGGDYAPTVSNPVRIDAVSSSNVFGKLIYLPRGGSNTVIAYFQFPFTPNEAGIKSLEMTIGTSGPTNTPSPNPFSLETHAIGHGTATVGTTSDYVPVQVYAVTGTNRVRVEWHSSHTSGVGKLRGSFIYSAAA